MSLGPGSCEGRKGLGPLLIQRRSDLCGERHLTSWLASMSGERPFLRAAPGSYPLRNVPRTEGMCRMPETSAELQGAEGTHSWMCALAV